MQHEEDMSQPATPTWDADHVSIANSRWSIDRTQDVEPAQDVTPLDADATLLPEASNAAFINALRQLVAIFLDQVPETEAPISTSPTILQPESASELQNLTEDELSLLAQTYTPTENALKQERVSDIQLSDHPNSRGESARPDHDGEEVLEYQVSKHSSSMSMQPTKHGRLRTKLSPRRLLCFLRKAGMSALCRKGHISPHGDQATFE